MPGLRARTHPRTKAGNVRVPHGRAPPMAPDKTDACCALAAAPDKTSANVHIGAQSVHRAAPKAKNGQNERECATACPKRARMCTFAREVSKRRLIRAFQLHIRTQSVQISPIRMHGGQNRRECAATLNGLGGCGKVGPASWIARAHKSNSPALSGGRIVKVAISSEVTPPGNP